MNTPAEHRPSIDEQAERAAGYWLLAAAVVVLLPHVERLPWWLSAVLALLFGWRFFMLQRGWPTPNRWLRWILTAALVATLWIHYGTLIGRDAGSSLLATMLALKFLELRRARDYVIGGFIIYFLILIGFLYSQSLWLGVYLLAVLVLTTAMLVRLAVPGYTPRASLRLAVVLLAQALPLMLAMHLFFPRVQGAFWGLAQENSGVTGLSDTMRPGMIHDLTLSEEVAFRAHFHDTNPSPADLYWRTIVLWQTDGETWRRGRIPEFTNDFQGTGATLSYSLTLEPSGQPWLPALDLPTNRPAGTRLLPGFVLERARLLQERVVLEMRAQPRFSITTMTARERAAALQLPGPGSERMNQLVNQLRATGGNDDGTVRAILQHFHREPFAYTLEPPLLGENPVEEFLFETRRGFCEHYAAAFVTLLRLAGIPARVVTGYQGGEHNPAGNYYIVRQSDAHAWAEAWLPDQGWVRVDPTAAVAPERIEYGSRALAQLISRGAVLGDIPPEMLRDLLAGGALDNVRARARLAWDAVNTGWTRWVLGYGIDRQRELLESLGLPDIPPFQLLGFLALLIALLLALMVWLSRVRQPYDPVLAGYRLFCRRLGRLGLVRAPAEGPQDYAERCALTRPDLAASVHALTGTYLRLRYDRPAGTGATRRFVQQVRRFRPTRRKSGS